MNAPTGAAKRYEFRGWLILFARWATGLLVLALLIYFLPLGQLRSALSHIAPTRFFGLLTIYLLALTGGIVKWHLVVNSADSRLPFSTSAQCYAGGLFGALFLPSIVGGDAVRLAVGISRSARPASVVTGNIVDRLLDLSAQLTLVLLGMSLIPGSPVLALKLGTRNLLLFAAIAAVALLVIVAILPRILRGRTMRFRRRLAQLRRAKNAVTKHPYRLILCWLLGISVQSTFLVITVLLGISCGLRLPFRVWLFAWPLSKIAGILPLTQGGIGIRETALLALLRPFGAPAAQVVATGIASEGVIVAGGLLAGMTAFLLRRKESTSKSH
jgi:glycosyltransferase 2 family protein